MLDQYQVNNFQFDTYNEINDNLLYLDYISSNYDFKNINISPDLAYRYQGNFYGLLRELNIDERLFFYTLYLNGLTCPTDYDGLTYTLKLSILPSIPQD